MRLGKDTCHVLDVGHVEFSAAAARRRKKKKKNRKNNNNNNNKNSRRILYVEVGLAGLGLFELGRGLARVVIIIEQGGRWTKVVVYSVQ